MADMDANVRARDERIQELSNLLDQQQQRGTSAHSNVAADMTRRLAAKDTELHAKVAKIEELKTVFGCVRVYALVRALDVKVASFEAIESELLCLCM